MWTKESRARYDRSALRYPSDMSDGEWAILAPLIPPAKHGGRPREVDIRAVMGGLLYVLETGCPWRHLPKDFPPKSTVHSYFELWAWGGTLAHIHDALYAARVLTKIRTSQACRHPQDRHRIPAYTNISRTHQPTLAEPEREDTQCDHYF